MNSNIINFELKLKLFIPFTELHNVPVWQSHLFNSTSYSSYLIRQVQSPGKNII